MYAAVAAGRASDLMFGRETAQFKELLAVMAIVSIVSWSVVFATMLLRLGLGRFWYRRRLRSEHPDSNI